MAKLWDEMRGALQFFGAGLRQLDRTASLFPSSRFLVREMLAHVPLANARCVVELGPGVGTVTEAILARLPPDAHLHSIELDETLLPTMLQRLPDPRLRAIHGSAVDAAALVQADGCALGAEVVFSSLGLSMMPLAVRTGVLAAATRLLAPDGHFVQYQYVHSRAMSYQPGEGFNAFDGPTFLRRWFEEVEQRFVTLNAPPAFVYTCRRVRATAEQRAPRRKLRVVGRR